MFGRSSYIVGWVLLALCGCGFSHPAVGQPSLSFERLDNRSGLSHNTVYHTFQDRQGYLWIGTAGGLNRFDGYSFEVSRHVPEDSTSLGNSAVTALLEDVSGTLWIGTEQGLEQHDPMTGRFRRYLDEGVATLAHDPRTGMWIVTFDGRVMRLDAARDAFADVTELGVNLLQVSQPLAIDTTGTPWLVRFESGSVLVERFNPAENRFERAAAFPASANKSRHPYIHAGSSGTLWLTGADHIDVTGVRGLRLIPPLPPGVVANQLCEDGEGILWIGTDGHGLFRFDPRTGMLSSHLLDGNPSSWLNNNIQHLFVDRTGILWIGTLGGLYRLDPLAKPFGHIGAGDGPAAFSDVRLVTAIHEDENGILWAGTLGSGLLRIDRQVQLVRAHRHDSRDPRSLSGDLVWSVREDSFGRLWISTNARIDAFDRATGRSTRLNVKGGSYQLAGGGDGTFWTGIGDHVIQVETSQRRIVKALELRRKPGGEIHGVLVDRSGRLWVYRAGLHLCDTSGGACRVFEEAQQDSLDLQNNGIWTIHEDTHEDGLLWLATDEGLVRVDARSRHFERVLDSNQIPAPNVYSILQDERRRLWMGTGKGLVRYDTQTGSVRVYDASDGVLNAEFNRNAAFKSLSGEFFFGGLDGITTFRPDDIIDNPHVPPVVVTHLELSGGDGTVVLSPEAMSLDGLVLKPGDHAVTFEFAALNFTNPEMNRYAYMLEGFDSDWVASGTRRFARYAGIPPGSYTFRVRGSNDDGLWNEKGAAMAVTVLPPFWQTLWFRLLAIGAVLGSLFGAHRYRLRKHLEVERLRFRIASDLHDDVGSKLSSVALIGEMVTRRAALEEREHRQLTEMTYVARTMVDDLRDIVWMVNPGYDTLDDLASKMQHTAATMLNGTSHTFHLPADGFSDGLDMERRRHLFLMFKEVLHNIHRHACASHVEIRLEHQNGRLTLDVHDDGVGFERSTVASGSGLQSISERARLLGGGMSVESWPGTGTIVRISAPV